MVIYKRPTIETLLAEQFYRNDHYIVVSSNKVWRLTFIEKLEIGWILPLQSCLSLHYHCINHMNKLMMPIFYLDKTFWNVDRRSISNYVKFVEIEWKW